MAAAAASVEDAGLARARQWIAQEFTPSTLSPAQQLDELRWFIDAARPYRGMTIRVVSETIPTHLYESAVLAKAFSDITGIHVIHEVTGED
ncbi:MAG: carbohydrate ABC transporter substrate-binding protein, partial [Gammaproteobacteria bacterium]|nr:carbohydrate ABC transporter substrate-binding protein [Gammaproteobacteria bacterium]